MLHIIYIYHFERLFFKDASFMNVGLLMNTRKHGQAHNTSVLPSRPYKHHKSAWNPVQSVRMPSHKCFGRFYPT